MLESQSNHPSFPVHSMDLMRESQTDMLDKVDLEAAIDKLDPFDRDIVVLWIWEDRKFHEIGEIVGTRHRGAPLTASAIRYHKNRIVQKLRTLLDD